MVIPLILKMPVVLLLEKAVIYRLLPVRSNIIMRSVIVAFYLPVHSAFLLKLLI